MAARHLQRYLERTCRSPDSPHGTHFGDFGLQVNVPYSIGIVRHCAPNVSVNVYTRTSSVWVAVITDIAARAVMDNDRHGCVHARVGGVVDATERHGVSAAGLDVPELDAAAVRIGVDAVGNC